MMKEPLVYVNGKFVGRSAAVVSVFDHGLLYGDGVFEGIRAYGGNVFQLDAHIGRLYDSAKYIQLEMPMPRDELVEAVLATLRKNQLRDAYIRVVVTRGTGDLGIDPSSCKRATIFVIAEPAVSILGSKGPKLHNLVIASVRRDSVDATSHEVKSLNYLNSVMARLEATNAKANDAIMLDSRGFVSEASATNVFMVKEKKVSTPATSAGILHGITRAVIIRLCSDLGFDVTERDVTPFELLTSDEVFLAGTKGEIVAIGSISGKRIGSGGVGPMTRRLYQEFARFVQRKDQGTPIYEAESVRI
ncbi:MAG TPA: branched-chain-amino-acid transaminase [Nitrososphaerales archaeon]|nr:branched-chain-amino-acid transaminase [Nitrososphaerales archaeon]